MLQDGWLDTGDLGFVADGELYVCGRAKDVVIIRGANHAPQEFEECLDGVAGVRQGCAVALGFQPDGGGEEQLLILAELGRRAGPVAREAASAPRSSSAPACARTPSACSRPGTLPRTSSGKLRRAEALRQFTAGELAAPRRVSRLRIAGARCPLGAGVRQAARGSCALTSRSSVAAPPGWPPRSARLVAGWTWWCWRRAAGRGTRPAAKD